MKIAFLLSFPCLFIIGIVFQPLPFNTFAPIIVGAWLALWALDHVGCWYAKRNRIGVVEETLGAGEVLTYFNNPWAKNWPKLRWFVRIFTLLQVTCIAATTILCGEAVRHILGSLP